MGRLIVLVVLGMLVVWWVSSRIARARRSARPAARPTTSAASAGSKGADTGMVACAHCGLHVPQYEAISDGQRNYCGDEHRRLASR